MKLLSKDFQGRSDLDDYVKNNLGEDIPANFNAGHTIEGTPEDLKRLSLSKSSRVYGVKVVITN